MTTSDTEPFSQNICDAFQHYGKSFGMHSGHKELGFNRQAFPWNNKQPTETGEESQTHNEQSDIGCSELDKVKIDDAQWVQFGQGSDLDGEAGELCRRCQLPLGELRYRRHTCGSGSKDVMHGECMASSVTKDMREEEMCRKEVQEQEKRRQREEYGIGWEFNRIPCNRSAASKLALCEVPAGMVCLVMDAATRSIRIAATAEPVAAVNLEYLSTVLEVRRREGHEPIFSLDPVDPNDLNSMQQKVFTPEWLAGTSAGEVLFQADYHLKELSMGECKQPVVGMSSCLDFEMEGDSHEWRAREWFLVRKAEVLISHTDALIPFVKMGVEAREQMLQGSALEDKQITQADHPMVKYAESFTHNFDLIAERKSVIYHLRELAKATVLARYLLEANVELDEPWFHAFEEDGTVCSLEVPQLWNRHLKSGAAVQGREISTGKCTHSVFGGVQFGVDRLNLQGRSLPTLGTGLTGYGIGRMPQISTGTPGTGPGVPPGFKATGALSILGARAAEASGAGIAEAFMPRQRLQFGLGRGITTPFSPPLRAELMRPQSAMLDATPARIKSGQVGTQLPAQRLSALGPVSSLRSVLAQVPTIATEPTLQGVDLRLDNFDLSSATRVSLEVQAGSWGGEGKALDECVAFGDVFWSNIDASSGLFRGEDRSFLKDVFHPELSDRRMEGDRFNPPDARHAYVEKLRALLKEEEVMRQQRKELFFSKAFAVREPGPLFPASRNADSSTPKGLSSNGVLEERRQGALHTCKEYSKHAAEALLHSLTDSALVFDKSTEEGLRFRVYRQGSLEVRTTQEFGSEEQLGAVFSIRAPVPNTDRIKAHIADREQITKVTQYVERAFVNEFMPNAKPTTHNHCYLVLESGDSNRIVTERLIDGRVTWEENPEDLEDRNSLAKVLRTKSTVSAVTVKDVKTYSAAIPGGDRYARTLCVRLIG